MLEHSAETVLEGLMSAIVKQDYVDNVKLEKNITIEGKISSHPVDLYWEFSDGDLVYKALIYSHTLNTVASRSDIIKIADLIHEIKGHSAGVLFTREVYDKNIKTLADNARVILCEMPPPLLDMWHPVVGNFKINADSEAIKKEKERLNITEEFNINNSDIGKLFLYNDKYECIDTLGGVVSSYVDAADPKKLSEQASSFEHVFAEPVFLQTGVEVLPFVKILGVSFTLKFTQLNKISDEEKEAENAELVKYILHNFSRYL